MTRETKIGLLVGLAFCIVLGILISDHLSSTNEPLSAPLRVAGENLRSGLGQVGSDDVAPVLRAPQAITPQQPVVINQELKQQPPVRFVEPPVIATSSAPTTPVADRLKKVAQLQGEEIVPAIQSSSQTPTPPAPPAMDHQAKAVPATAVARIYHAQAGDSLGSIAHKAYGSSSRVNCQAIVDANPSLEDNRDLIVAGRTYTIPSLDVSEPQTSQPAAPQPAVNKAPTYVVKQHDTLYSIAMLEVGTPSAISAIKELNREVLNGSDRLRPNMKLKLPGKNAE